MSTTTPKITFNATPQAAPAVQPGAINAGFMGAQPAAAQGLLQRNALPIAIGCVIVLTFVLGVLTTLLLVRPDPVQTAAAPVMDQRADLDAAVTRAATADLTSVGAAPNPITAELAAAVLEGLMPTPTVGKLTPQELERKAEAAQQIVNHNKMRMLREGVLAGLYEIMTEQDDGQKRIKLSALNAPLTAENVTDLLIQAAERGEIEMPASLATADGSIDRDTLLFNLIQTSLANDGTVEGAEAAREMSRRAFTVSAAKTTDVAGSRVYTVEPGDSLAYISLQFYGRPSDYTRIFEANRDILQSPDKLRIGQRLKIPS
ncbi:LysM peptidoglycan-binding domain-containing protein [Sulfitobacter albidus]|uniref:LysM peptidoglycan-binding domain-containing protein n=1 Tax=Sulfitobacter albidus TaxID=2829501 RepID=A0A975JDM6_9RHOB|nr:LysM peptidoglycan-binding domain-containing protein [Sulfitobacter albidus]QUJ76523.1 LysM peptidoglycan-binding domain-containing protein [Sulfitobacter albidus]